MNISPQPRILMPLLMNMTRHLGMESAKAPTKAARAT
jgi:hypothetical protein